LKDPAEKPFIVEGYKEQFSLHFQVKGKLGEHQGYGISEIIQYRAVQIYR
jgi:hypothetical protein